MYIIFFYIGKFIRSICLKGEFLIFIAKIGNQEYILRTSKGNEEAPQQILPLGKKLINIDSNFLLNSPYSFL